MNIFIGPFINNIVDYFDSLVSQVGHNIYSKTLAKFDFYNELIFSQLKNKRKLICYLQFIQKILILTKIPVYEQTEKEAVQSTSQNRPEK